MTREKLLAMRAAAEQSRAQGLAQANQATGAISTIDHLLEGIASDKDPGGEQDFVPVGVGQMQGASPEPHLDPEPDS